jgi:hypothetical protein
LFAQLVSAGIPNNGNMRVSRCTKSQQTLQQDLTPRGFQQIFASNDVGHALVVIIHYNGQLIRKESIGSKQDEIASRFREHVALSSLNSVVEFHDGVAYS